MENEKIVMKMLMDTLDNAMRLINLWWELAKERESNACADDENSTGNVSNKI